MLFSPSSLKLFTKGLRTEFFERFRPLEAAGAFQRLATRVPSDRDQETYRWVGTAPRMREWVDERKVGGLKVFEQTVANKKWENTVSALRTEIDDDQTGQIRMRVGELAAWAGQHKDALIGGLLNDGDAADSLAYDEKSFFADDHEIGESGTIDNKLTFDAADTDNPTTAECKAALRQAIAQMKTFKDDKGEPLAVTATGLVVVCPPNQEFAWREALNATIIANTSNVDANIAGLEVNQYLTDASKWFLLKTDAGTRPLIYQIREEIEFTAHDNPSSDDVFMKDRLMWGSRARYNMAYGQFLYAVQTDFV